MLSESLSHGQITLCLGSWLPDLPCPSYKSQVLMEEAYDPVLGEMGDSPLLPEWLCPYRCGRMPGPGGGEVMLRTCCFV